MTLSVETGAGLSDAESYVSVADCVAYAAKVGATFPGSTSPEILAAEQALRRATVWIDATYGQRFAGVRKRARSQALQWPRGWASDETGIAIAADSVPPEVVAATCEAAIRELASPGILSPDLKRGGAVKRYKAGSVEVEYSAAASAETAFTKIDGLLAAILAPGGVYSAKAVRG